MSNLNIILGNQLFDHKYFKKLEGGFFMCEDMELCTHFRPHKIKIYFFLCAMREYRDALIEKVSKVHYFELEKKPQFFKRLKEVIVKNKVSQLTVYEIEDKFFEKKIKDFAEKNNVSLNILSSPQFVCSRDEFYTYLQTTKKPFMKTFYEEQRKKHGILMDGDKPLGGKWSFDQENRKKIPKKFEVIKEMPELNNSPYKMDILKLIEKYFSDHPGSVENVYFPTNRKGAKKALKDFVENKISYFGDYEDAIDDRHPFLYHSLLSPLINIGLLTPLEVVKATARVVNEDNLNAVEGMVRQVIGWREFMRGIYQNYDDHQQKENFFGHKRKLNDCWYDGTTGIPVIDKTIKKVLKYGYCHHIERLMVLSNMMLILEVDPKEVHKWFMEMFVDSLDWVMGPNVYGMGQFSDGGVFATKPYFSGSNYILKMSHEKKGDWCDGWDGLYWGFIDKNRKFFKKNYRMSMMVSMFDKMEDEKKSRILKAANLLQSQLTN